VTGHRELAGELDRWSTAGLTVRAWWRDDDLSAPGPELDRLLEHVRALAVVPLLAVIPAGAGTVLAERLDGEPVAIAVHGWSHANHERTGRKAEFGPSRPLDQARSDLARARARIRDLFGPRAASVLVPPWNRIRPEFVAQLPGLGFDLLSTHGSRPSPGAVAGLVQINTHLDVIAWRGDRRFIGADAMARELAGRLAARRTAGPAEPVGLLTHHLAMSPSDWSGFARVCTALMAHPAVRMIDSRELRGAAGAA